LNIRSEEDRRPKDPLERRYQTPIVN